jgi:hypothetical protein
LHEANGYSSLQFIWHRDYLARILEVDDDLLDLWNVRYVIDPATYGAMPRYRGVDFLTGQMLMHAPAGSATSIETFSLPTGFRVSEVRIVSALMGAVQVEQDTPVALIDLRDASGTTVGRTVLLAGHETMEWASVLSSVQPYVRHQRAELAGYAFETGESSGQRLLSFASKSFDGAPEVASLTIQAVPPAGEVAIYGGAVVSPEGEVRQLFGRTKSKYREVYKDSEMRVLENTQALPRAFLVSRARWAPSIGASLGEMIHRPFEPRQEVIIAADTAPEIAANLPAADALGAPGTATVEHYGPNEVQLRTSSPADTLLVLSDTYYPGWRAYVDGREAPLVRGDLLFRVVPVPAGEHDVDMRFEPASIRLGFGISVVALIAVGIALVLAGRAHARSRTT